MKLKKRRGVAEPSTVSSKLPNRATLPTSHERPSHTTMADCEPMARTAGSSAGKTQSSGDSLVLIHSSSEFTVLRGDGVSRRLPETLFGLRARVFELELELSISRSKSESD